MTADTQAMDQHKEEEDEEFIFRHPQADSWKFVIRWEALIAVTLIHVMGVYGGYILLHAKPLTIIYTFLGIIAASLGITAGAHRLWTHRAYKAKTPLQILLAFFFLLSGQRSIVAWVTDHRIHHRYSDTDADPHNATRGFFFSFVGWLMVERHPEVEKQMKLVDVSDMWANPVVRFQTNYAGVLITLVSMLLPSYVPTLWGETFYDSFLLNMFRLMVVLFLTGIINSVAHLWGSKPIDKSVVGTQTTLIGILAMGEGFHNYHHVYPYDYRTSEVFDTKYNLTTMFIDFFAKIGWAYDLKYAPEEAVRSRVIKTGDGTDKYYK